MCVLSCSILSIFVVFRELNIWLSTDFLRTPPKTSPPSYIKVKDSTRPLLETTSAKSTFQIRTSTLWIYSIVVARCTEFNSPSFQEWFEYWSSQAVCSASWVWKHDSCASSQVRVHLSVLRCIQLHAYLPRWRNWLFQAVFVELSTSGRGAEDRPHDGVLRWALLWVQPGSVYLDRCVSGRDVILTPSCLVGSSIGSNSKQKYFIRISNEICPRWSIC